MTTPSTPDNNRYIVSLDKLFCEWGERFFEKHMQRDLEKQLKTKLRWKDLTKKLDYTNFFIETSDYNFNRLGSTTPKPTHHVVFKTTYSNTTSYPLEYTLNTERTTRNVTSFRLNNGFTSSSNVGLKLKLPGDICELEGGYSRELSMDQEQETSKEEEMTWSANTVVKVAPNTDTTLELIVEEQEYDGTFECNAQLSGEVVILVFKGESEITPLVAQNLHKVLPESMGFKYDEVSKKVTYMITGRCLCRRGMNQSIKLYETKQDNR